jgi:hypothetical protein
MSDAAKDPGTRLRDDAADEVDRVTALVAQSTDGGARPPHLIRERCRLAHRGPGDSQERVDTAV